MVIKEHNNDNRWSKAKRREINSWNKCFRAVELNTLKWAEGAREYL